MGALERGRWAGTGDKHKHGVAGHRENNNSFHKQKIVINNMIAAERFEVLPFDPRRKLDIVAGDRLAVGDQTKGTTSNMVSQYAPFLLLNAHP